MSKNAIKLAPFSRLGVSASLIRHCEYKADVYRLLQSRFPCLGLDTETSDDFSLQMNFFSLHKDARINRVERWSHGVFQRIDIPVLGTPEPGRVTMTRLEGLKLDLDFNTAPLASATLDADVSSELLEKLLAALFDKMRAT